MIYSEGSLNRPCPFHEANGSITAVETFKVCHLFLVVFLPSKNRLQQVCFFFFLAVHICPLVTEGVKKKAVQ